MQPDGLALEAIEVFDPLSDGESLHGAPRPHLLSRLGFALQGTHNRPAKLVQQMLRRRRLDGIPEPGHLTQTANTRAHAQRALASELDRDEAKWFLVINGLATGSSGKATLGRFISFVMENTVR